MALPLLPGNSFNRNLGKEKFHKSQHWSYCNKVSMMVGEDKPGIGGEPLLGQKLKPKYSVFPRGVGCDAPSWVAFDKQNCLSQTTDTQNCSETLVTIDCGTLLRRHRIPLPPPNEDQFYTVDYFNLDTDVIFYGQRYKIIDCDQFTKNFLRKMGVKVNPPLERPDDPYTKGRQKLIDSMTPLRPYERFDTLRQFLEHEGHVLRFYGVWDDTETMFGDIREVVLHYFLADDTIEIKEVIPINSGRDAVPLFLNRQKLPKFAPVGIYQPGTITDRTVLNVFGGLVGNKGRYILDNRKTGAVYQEFYKDCDLRIGATINVWGRKIILCDCDEFSKEYYKTKYGVKDFTPVPYKTAPSLKIERMIPPYSGFGSEEDSLCSCLSLLPKPPQKDFRKFMEKDRQGLESNILRFLAQYITSDPIAKDRKFIISYFLSDDTISVFEPPQRNTGVIGGKFLERSRIKKPGQEFYKSEPSEYYTAKDLFVGAKVCFHGHVLLLVDADEYAFNYMEKHADEYAMANINVILNKLKVIGEPRSREIKQIFAAADPQNTYMIDYDEFRNVLLNISDGKLSEHEIMTIGRYYSVREENEMDATYLLAVSQENLKKNNFENFGQLLAALAYSDREKCGLLASDKCRTVCKSFRLPLADDLLRALLAACEDCKEHVNYKKLVDGLNWREHPIPAFQTILMPLQYEDRWSGEPPALPVKKIKYLPLIEDVFGSKD
ncbi:EF-hand domain-containing family member C2 [Notechis scutatus]|uniref:EF-hand domain-containing family member C2 n=1 Tax=Notechis scutatus TaxID=8663 RepID=A0A6J1UFU8_9SAUR|nr:EF-hand domain-containing family member C2 [Notechis scutatus]